MDKEWLARTEEKNLISISSRVGGAGREENGTDLLAVDSPKVLPPPPPALRSREDESRDRAKRRRNFSHSLPAKEKADRENNNDLKIMRLLKRIIYFVKWR